VLAAREWGPLRERPGAARGPVGENQDLGGESRQLFSLGLLAGSENFDLLLHDCDDLICLLEQASMFSQYSALDTGELLEMR